ncbi:MAG: non-homologous end-joining DNA ligase [Firmicutes bacterium]|nr:non-homologous end-joining DNA ligase [Bacillota bacterium]
MPKKFAPMLATMAEPFDSPDFTYEIKWDGYRLLAFIENGTRLQSRNGKEITYLFPELAGIHQWFRRPGCLVDGEVIAPRDGKPSFAQLQQRAQLLDPRQIREAQKTIPVVYVVFDLLYRDGQPVYQEPLFLRRELLRETLTPCAEIILASWVAEKGQAYFESVSALGLEGVIAKRLDSVYLPGQRARSWLKFKKKLTDYFLICGYTKKNSSRGGLSSLILGAYQEGRLTYCGLVGTGFTVRELDVMQQELDRIRIPASPFSEIVPKIPGIPKREGLKVTDVIWVKPVIVCRVEYTEQTAGGSLRHPAFKEICPEVSPGEVIMPSEKNQ